MAYVQELVCDYCGFHYKNEGYSYFWLDLQSAKLRTSLQTIISTMRYDEETLLRGYVGEKYCSHCRNYVYEYHLKDCGENYNIERASDLLRIILKGYEVNIHGLRDFLYGGEASLNSFFKPKQSLGEGKKAIVSIHLDNYGIGLDSERIDLGSCIDLEGNRIDLGSCPNCGEETYYLLKDSPCPRCSSSLRKHRSKFLD